MQQVKIYTASPSDLSPPVQSESFCVDMVLASDYAELEEKFMALAAENAGLKSALNDILQPDAAVLERNHRVRALDAMETPATDAFLAEVRAIELDSLAGVAETMLIKFSNQQCSSDMHEVVGWKMILQQAANRAAQLRKGVAQ
ncbi:hypothetical protein AB1B38_004339 [Salmonella enterica]|nr:hypothetical protein [Salmonella enterica]ECZ5335800.1 hypothetical protein [Salmonella enterica subsp. enterica serovar Newport]EDI2262077.1 hypothetical protein [Salmonella enterica subsp. enterica serovar Muenchen]ECV3122348.1 hypothetical protein [Salmonella enterica]ECZ8133350.1 hypothetical protein [Salmonella enterica]